MRVGLTWLSRTSRRANMPARQGFQPGSGVSEVPKPSTQAGIGNRSGSRGEPNLVLAGTCIPPCNRHNSAILA